MLKVGTRPSPLAVIQTREAIDFLYRSGIDAEMDVVLIASDGDLDKTTPFANIEGSDFFTRQLEEALRRGEIDIAVHSAKDLEDAPPMDLTTAVLTPSLSPHECLVVRKAATLRTLPVGSILGTSSQKRAEAIRRFRPDLRIKDIRGTIQERVAQLDSGDYDALIMAHAALIRLGLEQRIAEIIPPEIIPPHPLQGRLALQVRSSDEKLIRLLSPLATVQT